MFNLKIQQRDHVDVINDNYCEIAATFQAAGAEAPETLDLYESEGWRYCSTSKREHRNKIGYIVNFSRAGGVPIVKITVHSFCGGESTIVFNSYEVEKRLRDSNNPKVTPKFKYKTTTPFEQEEKKKKDQEEVVRKEKNFKKNLLLWSGGDTYVGDHPYVIAKGITQTYPLRRIDRNHIAFGLTNIDGDVCGVQFIDHKPKSIKINYGKIKGNFCALGDIDDATHLYLCEGYATGSAIFELIKLNQKRKAPICVIVAVNAGNLIEVARALAGKYKDKTLVSCPDNDYKNDADNVGMLSGLKAAIESNCEIKIIPEGEFKGSNKGVDWCDALQENPTKAAKAFATTTKLSKFEATCERLKCFAKGSKSNELKEQCANALRIGSKMYPTRITEKDILAPVINATKHTKMTNKDIYYKWGSIKKKMFGQSARTKTISRLQGDNVRVIKVKNLSEAHAKLQVIKGENTQGVFITTTPMGTGKTKHFLQPEFAACEREGRMPAVITPNRALTKGVSERFGASHYIDDLSSIYRSNGENGESYCFDSLAITINSIISPKFQEQLSFAQSIYIDEYTQVVRSISGGTVENHQRELTERKLASLIEHSRYTYIADADFNQIALNHIVSTVGDRPIFIFQMDEVGTEDVEYKFYRDHDAKFSSKLITQDIVNAAISGQKIYVVSDSKEQLETINMALGETETLLITGDTAGFPDQKDFIDNPNAYLKENSPQVVLASPCIQSGISIEVEYFDRCFGSYSGIVTPAVFQQMIHRLRPQKIFEISLPSWIGSLGKAQNENSTAILIAAYMEKIGGSKGAKKAIFDPTTRTTTIGDVKIGRAGETIELEGDDDFARYEILSAEMQALDSEQMRNAANFFLIQAIIRGIKITPIITPLDDPSKGRIKSNHKENKALASATKVKKTLAAKTIDHKEYKARVIAGSPATESDLHKIRRYEISKDLNKKSETLDSDDLKFHNKQGCKYTANYQALLQGPDKARDNDIKDKKNGVAKTDAKRREDKVDLLSKIFNLLMIDILTGEGSYTADKAREVREAILQDQSLRDFLVFKLKLSPGKKGSDIAFVNKILKKLLGLTAKGSLVQVDGKRVRHYVIRGGDMEKLTKYHAIKFQKVTAQIGLKNDDK